METSSPRRSRRPSFHLEVNSDSDEEHSERPQQSNPAATSWIMSFCSESLYSFSYAYNLNDAFYSRLMLLKKSLQMLKDKSTSTRTLQEALMSTPRLSSSYLNLQASLFPEMRALKHSMSSATLSFLSNIRAYTTEESTPEETATFGESIDHLLELLDRAITKIPNEQTDPHRVLERTVSNPAIIMNSTPILGTSGSGDNIATRGRESQKGEGGSRFGTEDSGSSPHSKPSPSIGSSPIHSPPVGERRKRTLTGMSSTQLQDRLLDALATPYVDFYMRNSRDIKRSQNSPTPGARNNAAPFFRSVSASASKPASSPTSSSGAGLHSTLVQQLNTNMSMLNLGALSAQAESLGSNSDLPGFNITPLHPLSSKYSSNHALFTSNTSDPFTIYSCNDMACLMFGLSQHEIKNKPIMALIANVSKETFQEELEHNISRKQVLFCGELFVVVKANGSESLMSFWAKTNAGGVMIWILEEVMCDITSVFVHPDTGIIHRIVGDHSQLILSKSNSANNSKRPSTVDENSNEKEKESDNDKENGHKNDGLDTSDVRVSLDDLLPNLKQHSNADNDNDDEGTSVVDGLCLRFIDSIRHLRVNRYKFETLQIDTDLSFPCLVSIRKDPDLESEPKAHVQLDIASLPHISGTVIVDRKTLKICDYNESFLYSLLGYLPSTDLRGKEMSVIIPKFADIFDIVVEDIERQFSDTPLGLVIPEYTFRKAAKKHLSRSANSSASSSRIPSRAQSRAQSRGPEGRDSENSRPSSPALAPAAHVFPNLLDSTTIEAVSCKGGSVKIDFQLRVVTPDHYAVWITYCRHIHGPGLETPSQLALLDHALHRKASLNKAKKKSGAGASAAHSGASSRSSTSGSNQSGESVSTDPIPVTDLPGTAEDGQLLSTIGPFSQEVGAKRKSKTLKDFKIINKMGEGAYGKVLLVKSRQFPDFTAVLKCVFKDRILVDTWTRDRKLGTIPNEIKIMATLNTAPHDNIIRLIDFFEDETFYHIEMERHGNPGSDLFDLIELKPDMTEEESKSIFQQTVSALSHLHKHGIVHRDIKDENVVVDEKLRVKLIDFGSAAFCRQGPFDVFVGTVDYAAPEVLSGNTYEGKPQDVWAMGILLYTILYKENPFYNVDEIMDGDLRIPYDVNPESVSLIKMILKRNVRERPTIFDIEEHPWLKDGPKLIS